MTTSVSVYREGGNPVFNCISVEIDDEAAGSYLVLRCNTDGDRGEFVKLDWDEWDAVVEVVNENRKEWEYTL